MNSTLFRSRMNSTSTVAVRGRHLTGALIPCRARQVLDENKLAFPLIVGTGLVSTRETTLMTRQAADAGADVVLVIPSGYYASLMTRQALKAFFMDVQAASPVPVMLYNFPGAAGGVDMDSDLLLDLAREGSNFCGAKLT